MVKYRIVEKQYPEGPRYEVQFKCLGLFWLPVTEYYGALGNIGGDGPMTFMELGDAEAFIAFRRHSEQSSAAEKSRGVVVKEL